MRTMLCLMLLVPLIVNAKANNSVWNGDVVNDPDLFPFMVSIQDKEFDPQLGPHRCGGVFINKQSILTAGHCVTTIDGSVIPRENLRIRYGTLDVSNDSGHVSEIESIVLHPGFMELAIENNEHIPLNDLAIIKL